ncbi:MAG TPA: RNA polymerase sigma factor [Rhizomicrobium sp.]|jgi:RNA polymerase sigma-70 factor (ECF subfamily)
MAKTPETNREDAYMRPLGAAITAPEVRIWFVRQVLPLEVVLKQFLHHNWHNKADVDDLLQEVYVRVCESARNQIPEPAKPFVFTVARNLLIDRVRRERIIPIEAVADLDALEVEKDEPGPERNVIARDELRRLQAALDRLPPRAREAIVLKQVDGLSRREIAERMGIGEGTVKQYVADGIRALATLFFSEPTP